MSLPGRSVSAGTLVPNYGVTNVKPTQKDQPLFSLKRGPHFQTHNWCWNEHNLGHRFWRVPKIRTTVLARASNNLLDCTGSCCLCVYVSPLIHENRNNGERGAAETDIDRQRLRNYVLQLSVFCALRLSANHPFS
jgi:hypothetical protein